MVKFALPDDGLNNEETERLWTENTPCFNFEIDTIMPFKRHKGHISTVTRLLVPPRKRGAKPDIRHIRLLLR